MNHCKSKLILFCYCLFGTLWASAQSYTANGSAIKILDSDCYRLTEDKLNQNGTIWFTEKLNLKVSFSLEFYLNFGSTDDGADGIVFAMQTVGPNALGNAGGGLGFSGFNPALGIEFDDFQNIENLDPAYDHIALVKNGSLVHPQAESIFSPVSALKNNGNIENGKDHLVKIIWDSQTFKLEVYFDCLLRLQITNFNISKEFFNDQNAVWWGFTGSTGGKQNNQNVCIATDALRIDSLEICQGRLVALNAAKSIDGVYSWSPATFLTSSNSQSTTAVPQKSMVYTVTYKDLCNQIKSDKCIIKVKPAPAVFLGMDTFLCHTKNIEITPKYISDTAGFFWMDLTKTKSKIAAAPGKIWATVTNTCGKMTDTLNLKIPKSPQFTLGRDTFICPGTEYSLKPNLTGDYVSLEWNDNYPFLNRIFYNAGKYWLFAHGYCSEFMDTIIISEYPINSIHLGNDTTLCAGDSLQLELDKYIYISPMWMDGNTDYSRWIKNAGTYKVTATNQHCVTSDSIELTIDNSPYYSPILDTIYCLNVPLKYAIDRRNTKVLWDNNDTNFEKVFQDIDGIHWVNINAVCGNILDSFKLTTMDCNCQFWIPTAFTPGVDQSPNNALKIEYDCKYTTFSVIIYDRWGSKIWENNSPDFPWDGNYLGYPIPEGVYAWVATYKGPKHGIDNIYTQKGTITILR